MGFGSNYAWNKYSRDLDEFVTNWLYGEYDKQKLDRFTALYSIPGVRQYFDYLLDKRSDQEYMARYGLTYADIHDPRKLKSTGSGSHMVGYAYNFVSRNASNLYKDSRPKKKR